MQPLRLALIQTHWPGERQAMNATYRYLVQQAAQAGAQLVCLPEFSISPYFPGTTDPRGFAWGEALPGGESEQFFSELARENNIFVVGSLYERLTTAAPDSTNLTDYRDTATIHAPNGQMLGYTRKVHIPSGKGYNETHFFMGESAYPVHNLGHIQLAVPTCYDQWFPEMARICALNGAELIFYPTAIGSEPTAPEVDSMESWQTVMRGHAIANGVFIAAANRIGQENGVTFYGSSFICDPTGRMLAQASRNQTEIIMADLDPQTLTQWRKLFPLLQQRRPETYLAISQSTSQPSAF